LCILLKGNGCPTYKRKRVEIVWGKKKGERRLHQVEFFFGDPESCPKEKRREEGISASEKKEVFGLVRAAAGTRITITLASNSRKGRE